MPYPPDRACGNIKANSHGSPQIKSKKKEEKKKKKLDPLKSVKSVANALKAK
jgi:hypothetical protein